MWWSALTKLLVVDTGVVINADKTVVAYLVVVVCINQTEVDTGVLASADLKQSGKYKPPQVWSVLTTTPMSATSSFVSTGQQFLVGHNSLVQLLPL